MQTIIMTDNSLHTLADIVKFLQTANPCSYSFADKHAKYTWISETLFRFKYLRVSKKEKSILHQYIRCMTSLSKQQLKRLIHRHRQGKELCPQYHSVKRHRVYTLDDISLLLEVDYLHRCINGSAVKEICRREYEVFGNLAYKRLAYISVSHIYNIRKLPSYLLHTRTQAPAFYPGKNIAERRKPNPSERPGFLRVDTVHQGDFEKEKGVYYINFVDEVTQMEAIFCVEGISESFIKPIFQALALSFPYKILGIHSDNGSEYINYAVCQIISKFLKAEFTKSRAGKSNDNALVESKNGAIIRKLLGYAHIPRHNAMIINEFFQKYYNRYLCYHRPCLFATKTTDAKGKIRKKYNISMVPYEKLKSLENAQQYLLPHLSFDTLDTQAYKYSDNQYAYIIREEFEKLMKAITF